MFDVEAAFLNATPGTTMHIGVPEMMIKCGMITKEEADKIAYLLMKSMNGNIDARCPEVLSNDEGHAHEQVGV